MRIVHGWKGLEEADKHASVAYGNFDGVHRGHQKVIAQAAKAAQEAYEAFWTVHAAIIGLSRENSNIEAIALTMGRKQLLQAKILADLTTLAAVIDEKQFTATR